MTIPCRIIATLLCVVPFFTWSSDRYRYHSDTTLTNSLSGISGDMSIYLPLEYQHGLDQHFPLLLLIESSTAPDRFTFLEHADSLSASENIPSSVVVTARFAANTSPANAADFIRTTVLGFFKEHYHAGDFTVVAGSTEVISLLTHRENKAMAFICFYPQLQQLDEKQLRSSFSQKNASHATSVFILSVDEVQQTQLEALRRHVPGRKAALQINSSVMPETGITAYLTEALTEIYAFWSMQQENYLQLPSEQPATMASAARSSITAHYGAAMNLSLGALNGKGWMYYENRKFEQAISAWETLLRYYPNFSEALLYIAYARTDLGEPIDDVLQAFRENFAKSLFYSDEEQHDLQEEYQLLLSIRESLTE